MPQMASESEAAAVAATRWHLPQEEARQLLKMFAPAIVLSLAIALGIWAHSEPPFHLSLSIEPQVALPDRYDPATGTTAPQVYQTHVGCPLDTCIVTSSRPGCAVSPAPGGSPPSIAVYMAPMATNEPESFTLLMAAVAESSRVRIVSDPADACFVFPGFDTRVPGAAASLSSVPTWGSDGLNHIVVDDTVSGCDAFAAGMAIRWYPLADERCYWFHHDLIVPPVSAVFAAAAEVDGADRPAAERAHLLVVAASPGALPDLAHDPPYVIRCEACSGAPHPASPKAAEEAALFAQAKYVVLDVFAPGGVDRLFRAIASGAVPIVYYTGYTIPVLPLAEAIPWEENVFFIQAAEAALMPEELYKLSDAAHASRVATLAATRAAHLDSVSAVVDTAFDILITRISAAATAAADPNAAADPLVLPRALADAPLHINYIPTLRDAVGEQ